MYSFLPKEQEEEMSCWEGAEGGSSRAQRHQSEGDMGHNFLCDDAKLDGLSGPKFRSLRHLRQVYSKSFSATSSLMMYLHYIEASQLKAYISPTMRVCVCSAGPRASRVPAASVACADGKPGHMERR